MAYFQKLPLKLYAGEGIGLLILLRPLARKLPKGIHMIVAGGFSNLILVVYYLVMLIGSISIWCKW